MEFDIAVVGGGPGGLAAALTASRDASQPIVVERKKKFDDEVVCGEFIPSEAEIHRLVPQATGLKEYYRFLTTNTLANRTRLIRMYAPDMSAYEFRFDGIVLNKSCFNAELANAVEKRGAKTLVSASVLEVRETSHSVEIVTKVQGTRRTILSRFVIGADGFPSIVARTVGLETGYDKTDSALCFNALVEGIDCDPDAVEVYVGKDVAPGGYAWIIPKGQGLANVGLGVRLCSVDATRAFSDYVRRFLEGSRMAAKMQRARIIAKSYKIVPVGGLVRNVATSRVVLAGDAAGTVIAINGSGIPTALVSGSIAGNYAATWLRDGDSAGSYRMLLENQLLAPIRRGLRYRRVADVVMRSDWVFNMLVKLFGSSLVERTLRNE